MTSATFCTTPRTFHVDGALLAVSNSRLAVQSHIRCIKRSCIALHAWAKAASPLSLSVVFSSCHAVHTSLQTFVLLHALRPVASGLDLQYQAYFDRMGEITDDENDMLDLAYGLTET